MSRRDRHLVLACFVACVLFISIFSSIGVEPPLSGIAAAGVTILVPGLGAVAWMLGAYGIGHVILRGRHRELAWPVGISTMLVFAHGMGVAGLLRASYLGAAVAWTPIVVGMFFLILQQRTWKDKGRLDRLHPLVLLLAPATALVLVAACAPPGTLWRSEAGGFDVLSYHLQLPREWLANGQLWPLQHNTYSWLPSFMEAGYLQIGAMLWPAETLSGDPFVGGSGAATYACQILHVLIGLTAAYTLGKCLTRETDSQAAGIAAAGLMLCTPWVIVTASLAYNEMVVLLCFAGVISAVTDSALGQVKRGLIVGFLVGVAASAKPTALVMIGPASGVLLLALTNVKEWPKLILAGTCAGLFVLAPWLVRNELAGGNPIFPFGTEFFGAAHWDAGQILRWNGAHHASMPFMERVILLFSARGMLHPQWSIVFALAVLAIVGELLLTEKSRLGRWLVLALALQILAWLIIGHQQSRFLLPCLPVIAALFALVLARLPKRLGTGMTIVVVIGLSVHSVLIWKSENAGLPNLGLVGGVPALTGELIEQAWPDLTDSERLALLEAAGPAAYINLELSSRADSERPTLFLLGDSIPYYYRIPVIYHTTWERSPAPELLGRTPGESNHPTHVLLNLDELARLHQDGWYDPAVTGTDALKWLHPPSRWLRSWGSDTVWPPRFGQHLIEFMPGGTTGDPVQHAPTE